MKDLQTQEQRRNAIAWAVALTAETPLAPDHYENDLLEQYAQGHLTLAQVLAKLDRRVQHLLYHSQATHPMNPCELNALTEESQVWNETHNITGLLCYSGGHFVQVLEGTATDVQTLSTKIRQDRRHHHVVALSTRATNTRWFVDWRMALVEASLQEVFWLLGYMEAKSHNLAQPHIPLVSSHLMGLVEELSKL